MSRVRAMCVGVSCMWTVCVLHLYSQWAVCPLHLYTKWAVSGLCLGCVCVAPLHRPSCSRETIQVATKAPTQQRRRIHHLRLQHTAHNTHSCSQTAWAQWRSMAAAEHGSSGAWRHGSCLHGSSGAGYGGSVQSEATFVFDSCTASVLIKPPGEPNRTSCRAHEETTALTERPAGSHALSTQDTAATWCNR